MKENLFRFAYVILGVWVGFYTTLIFPGESGILRYLIFCGIGIIVSISLKETYLKDSTPAEIVGLIIGFAFSNLIARILRYLIALAMLFGKFIKWLCKFQIIQIILSIIVIIIAVYVIYGICNWLPKKIKKLRLRKNKKIKAKENEPKKKRKFSLMNIGIIRLFFKKKKVN